MKNAIIAELVTLRLLCAVAVELGFEKTLRNITVIIIPLLPIILINYVCS